MLIGKTSLSISFYYTFKIAISVCLSPIKVHNRNIVTGVASILRKVPSSSTSVIPIQRRIPALVAFSAEDENKNKTKQNKTKIKNKPKQNKQKQKQNIF